MTALPRNPVDVPINPLQAQKAATGRPGSELSSGPRGEGEAATSFSSLMGKLHGSPQDTSAEAVPNHAQVKSGPELLEAGSVENSALLDSASLNIDLEKTGGLEGAPRMMESSVASDGRLDGLNPAVVPAGQLAATLHGRLSGPQAMSPAIAALASKVQSNAGQPAAQLNPGAVLPADGRGHLSADAKTEPKIGLLGDGSAQPTQVKIEQAVIARADLSAVRAEPGPLDRRRSEAPSGQTPPQMAHAAMPQQIEADARLTRPQAQAAPVQVDPLSAQGPQVDLATLNQTALSGTSQQSTGGSDELPRVQDVRVTSSRVVEMAPAPSDRAAQPTTVKVIDLQLQPDTLGRINAQLKQTAEGLEIRLEPSLAETALLLKEDRLALQRILGSLGSGQDPTVVRIVDPVAEQEQADGQDDVAEQELGEAGEGSDWLRNLDDIYDERRTGGEYQNVQPQDVEGANTGGDRRAAGDIYI